MNKFLEKIFIAVLYYSGLNALYMVFRKSHLVVLGYHSISSSSNASSFHNEVYKHLSVPVELFERQLQYLQKHGYEFLRFSDLRSIRKGDRALSHRAAIVYFDDGYKDNYYNAYPVLKRMGIPAAIFVVTECLDQKKILWDVPIDSATANIFLTWDECNAMKDIFEIGSHTVTHRKLTALSLKDVRAEFAGSRSIIEQKTGSSVTAMSYPKSRFTMDIKHMAGENYEFVLAHGRGFQHSADLKFLQKIPVGPDDTIRAFRIKLGLYYPLLRFLTPWRSRS